MIYTLYDFSYETNRFNQKLFQFNSMINMNIRQNKALLNPYDFIGNPNIG